MQFCPQCDNVMDIGKSIPKVNLLQNTPNAVTTTSQSQVQEDIVDKLINAYKNKDNLNFEKEMEPIMKYNDVDCKIMWDILNALNKK